eukprot:1421637-Alexandrium_andersonii.AAC.1
MVAGREWRPGAPTFASTGLAMGLSALLRRLREGCSDLDTEWRRVVAFLVGSWPRHKALPRSSQLRGSGPSVHGSRRRYRSGCSRFWRPRRTQMSSWCSCSGAPSTALEPADAGAPVG